MNPMRTLTAFALVAMLALTLAVMGCGGGSQEPAATPPPAETPHAEPMSTDSMMADTSQSMGH